MTSMLPRLWGGRPRPQPDPPIGPKPDVGVRRGPGGPPRVVLVLALVAGAAFAQPRTEFRVKYISGTAIYLDGGRDAGLAEGMKLAVEPGPNGAAAELQIMTVASASAVCEVKSSKRELKVGDIAKLSAEDAQAVLKSKQAAAAPKYAQVVTFTEGDPVDEEMRAAVPRPPLHEINRPRGRIGFEYGSIHDHAGFGSSQAGLVFRGDFTRIGGTYWNLSGYWRGRMNSRQSSLAEGTLTDLLNRTYHLTLYYDNPNSAWRAGIGRMYLPWASSLDTIDGGYFGRRFGKAATVGMFAGSTPDPTSWNYNPDRQLLGTFVNYEGGDFESVRYSSTAGVAVSRIKWRPEREFAFFENAIFFQHSVSIYHNLEADQVARPAEAGGNVTGIARSFLTVRVQPSRILSIDVSHNYFRDVPTFDPRLIGTGLLDKLLFQGVSAGVRVELPYRMQAYTNLGRSDRTGDAKYSLNQMYGFAVGDVLHSGIRADARYSRFDSAFGRGTYRSLSLTREMGESLRLDLQFGQQNFTSAFTANNRARFVNGTIDWFFTGHYFLGGGLTVYRGQVQRYEQTFLNLGYRF